MLVVARGVAVCVWRLLFELKRRTPVKKPGAAGSSAASATHIGRKSFFVVGCVWTLQCYRPQDLWVLRHRPLRLLTGPAGRCLVLLSWFCGESVGVVFQGMVFMISEITEGSTDCCWQRGVPCCVQERLGLQCRSLSLVFALFPRVVGLESGIASRS